MIRGSRALVICAACCVSACGARTGLADDDDASVSMRDAGGALRDGGASGRDGGGFERDAGGVSERDAGGVMRRDAGVRPGDAGSCETTVPLCGGGTCAVLVDEAITPAFGTNDVASITLDASGAPAVLVELESGMYDGLVARRGAMGWTLTPLPVPLATGALALGAPGPLVIAAYDGAAGTVLLSETDDGGFAVTATLPTEQIVYSSNAARAPDGVVHVVSTGGTGAPSSSLPTLHSYDGAFVSTPLGSSDVRAVGGQIAIGPNGGVYVAWKDDYEPLGPRNAGLRFWRAETGVVETAAMGAGVVSGPIAMVIRDVGGVDVPTIAVADFPATPLSVVHRDASGVWGRTPVLMDPGPMRCFGPMACSVPFRGVSLIASPDAVHALFALNVMPPGGPRTAILALAVVPGPLDTFDELLVHDGVELFGARAVRDCAGQVHVAYVETDRRVGTTTARYALLGAR